LIALNSREKTQETQRGQPQPEEFAAKERKEHKDRNLWNSSWFFAVFGGMPASIGFVFLCALRDSARAMKPSPFDCDAARCVHSAFCISLKSAAKSPPFQHPDSQHLAQKPSHRAPTTGQCPLQSIYHLAFIIYTSPQSPLTKIRTYC
jgi:hypothetical protein